MIERLAMTIAQAWLRKWSRKPKKQRGPSAAQARDLPSTVPFPWPEATGSCPPPLGWWHGWEGDPNQPKSNGLTPLLWAAWDGNAPLMAILHHKGANTQAAFQGKEIIELAIESRNLDAIRVAIQLSQDPEQLASKERTLVELPCAIGMTQSISEYVQEEIIRRQAYRLDQALEAGTKIRERGRL